MAPVLNLAHRVRRMSERARHHKTCLRMRAEATQEIESELRLKLVEQQTLMLQAGVPAIVVTEDVKEIALQRRIVRLIQTTDEMAAQKQSEEQQKQGQHQIICFIRGLEDSGASEIYFGLCGFSDFPKIIARYQWVGAAIYFDPSFCFQPVSARLSSSGDRETMRN